MSIIRRAILAFALIAGITPAIAQVPAPVPALPDTERRTSYSLTSSTCACAVGFALYGDSTDYQNWVEVLVNGVVVPAAGNWAITSPTGPLANLPRPITDAVLNFTAARTGTVQIIGARRPRRTTQFPENQGVPARNLNQALTDIVAQNREVWDKTNDFTGRALLGQPGNTYGLMPLPGLCTNGFLGFDATGLIPICRAGGAGSGNVVGPLTSVIGDIPLFANTTGNLLSDGATRSGNTAVLATVSGAITSGNCLKIDASGNVADSGAVCGSASNTPHTQVFLAVTNFTAGTTTQLTLSSAPTGTDLLMVFFDGVAQASNTWSLASAVITFSAAIPTNTQVVEAKWSTGNTPSGVGSITSPTATLSLSNTTGAVSAEVNLAHNFTWTGTNNFNGDVCFKDGKPWADITCWGAIGNNTTANDVAVQNAINSLITLGAGGGTVYTPPGTFCFTAGVSNQPGNTIRYAGASARASIWSACGNNITPLTMNAPLSVATDMNFFGKGWNSDVTACCATAPAFKVDTSCIFCQINNAEIQGGTGVKLVGGDWYLHHVTANNSYGSSIFYIGVGGFATRAASDQNFTVMNPTGTVSVVSWTASTAVTSGTNTMLACGGYTFQVKTSGTTGSTCPSPKNYFLDIPDGSAVLQLGAPSTYYGWQIDTNGSEVALIQIDASCFVCTYGIAMTNSLSGTPPGFLTIHQSVLLGLLNGLGATSGHALTVTDSHGSCQTANCAVIGLLSSWIGDATIHGNHFTSSPNGIAVQAGAGVSIIGNQFDKLSQWSVAVSANMNSITVMGNILGSSVGATANGILITAGSSNHVAIVGNVCNNVTTTCISNGAGGTFYVPAGGNP